MAVDDEDRALTNMQYSKLILSAVAGVGSFAYLWRILHPLLRRFLLACYNLIYLRFRQPSCWIDPLEAQKPHRPLMFATPHPRPYFVALFDGFSCFVF
ncbi:MAG: hypothetical protein Q9171_006954 [Xanthocarpia ochracea]